MNTGDGTQVCHAAVAVFLRDCLAEVRQWHALNVILMFGLVSLSLVSVGLRGDRIQSPTEASAIFWTVQFFTAMSALSRSFVREEDARTAAALRLSAAPTAVYLGKLAFNLALMLVLDLVMTPGFLLLVNRSVGSPAVFVAMTLAGSFSLGAGATVLGAIAARAGSRSALFAVIAFPLLLPGLIPAIHGTALAFAGRAGSAPDLQFILCYGIMCVVAALILFPVVWRA